MKDFFGIAFRAFRGQCKAVLWRAYCVACAPKALFFMGSKGDVQEIGMGSNLAGVRVFRNRTKALLCMGAHVCSGSWTRYLTYQRVVGHSLPFGVLCLHWIRPRACAD